MQNNNDGSIQELKRELRDHSLRSRAGLHSCKFLESAKVYVYSYRKTGRKHVEKMKELAKAGKGLSAYISRYVKELFE